MAGTRIVATPLASPDVRAAPPPQVDGPAYRAVAGSAHRFPLSIVIALVVVPVLAMLLVRITSVDSVTGVYGPGIRMDGLNNTQVGGPNNVSTSYRFRATTSSALNSVRVYVIGPTYAGYGAGTGGTWQVTVQTDDGTGTHAPSGTVLATTTFQPGDVFPVIFWSSPATLASGRLYHVVFKNVDPNSTANFASVNGVFMYQPTVALDEGDLQFYFR